MSYAKLLALLGILMSVLSIALASYLLLTLEKTSRILDNALKYLGAVEKSYSVDAYSPVNVRVCLAVNSSTELSRMTCTNGTYLSGSTLLAVISKHYEVAVRSDGVRVWVESVRGEPCNGSWKVYATNGSSLSERYDLLLPVGGSSEVLVVCEAQKTPP
ncbi:hypothetical protein Tpen_0845 [Thermofilum pendens Hrk 5]|uniref:Uncharacterized protein n=2 Tax=Thermofilum pendens TaxID=2269 RepID=A1RYG6_THEPD|nr:hypothetical protein Tpen_0845 [Thermofilum pendens Hrk 5]